MAKSLDELLREMRIYCDEQKAVADEHERIARDARAEQQRVERVLAAIERVGASRP
ncbi:MAG: hypothetical protein QOJ29_3358 [Thermoleophilaceae bacterium]|jgi:hypothetical protein|nr:hypothetical protein [Thermoleophilaceae bacterium]